MERQRLIAQMEAMRDEWDLIVIGGGATGLGVALDAVTRGYRTLLLERGDFASETSSRSTKLIHGGVRYLRQGHFQLIRKALLERARLFKNAPHLVHPCSFVIPAENRLELLYYWTGLKFYDFLAAGLSTKPSSMLSKSEVLSLSPNLLSDDLAGGVVYTDGQFDDSRLAINLAQTIVDHDGVALNYMEVNSLLKERDKVVGVVAHDLESNAEYLLRAKVVVNATGSFADTIRRLDDQEAAPCLTFSQGTHIVVPKRFFSSSHALVIPKTADGRVIFLIPWYGRVLIGTTETVLSATRSHPQAFSSEISYLLKTVSKYLIQSPTESDVLGYYAGIRPLVNLNSNHLSSSEVSRDHQVLISPSGLVSAVGGKWTTYRLMAQETVDIAAKVGDLRPEKCKTADLRIHGWQAEAFSDTYGADQPLVEELAKGDEKLLEQLHPNIPIRTIDVVWSVKNEMARKVEDILFRRTKSLQLDVKASCEIVPLVAKIMARELSQDAHWERTQVVNVLQMWQLGNVEKKITERSNSSLS